MQPTLFNKPENKDWNYFWSLRQSHRFSQISWSKKRIVELLIQYAQTGQWALDAGCGSGFFSKFFCDAGMNVVALDYSQSALDLAKQVTDGKIKTCCLDLLKENLAGFFEQRFDLIFTDGLFEHFLRNEQDKILQNLISVLAPCGVIITFVPNRWSPWELIRPFYMPGIEEKPFVFNELIDLNVRNGLTVTQKGGINTLPFFLSPDRSLGRYFGMLLYTTAHKNV